MLGSQTQNPNARLSVATAPHARRMRRRRVDIRWAHRDIHPANVLLETRQAILGSTQEAGQALFAFAHPLSKLDELKARHFTFVGRQARITRSLTALHQPVVPVLSNDDWHWLDEHSDLENEFE